MIKRIILIFFMFSFTLSAQEIYSPKDVQICKTKFKFAYSHNLSSKPIGDIIVDIGKTFIGTNYAAHTLEKGEKENLVIHLSGLDCYTFFESSLALARCIKLGKTDFKDFENQIGKIRYRNGIINGFASRLNYMEDWLSNNQKKGIVKDVTKQIGGILYKKKIDFMSTHPNLYKRLKNNPEVFNQIKAIEDSINSRKYYYIPQNDISKYEKGIHNGDIIFLTTGIAGLDIGHTGIAVKMKDGRIHFMHAPDVGKKVQITKVPLSEYVKMLRRHTGIMVIRPLNPKMKTKTN